MNDTCPTCLTPSPELRQQYVSASEAEDAIQEAIHAQLDNAPHRLINTSTGYLCNRDARIDAFKTSSEFKELLSSTMMRGDLQMERLQELVATYFHFAMLSHRWEASEPLLNDIKDEDVYKLNPVGGIFKLQSFCRTARDAGYQWAWSDTCCIDQNNNMEVQESVNSMFVWYRHSALTIIYLSDVPPSSKSGALAKSTWNKRGWTVQEFLASKIVLFYQKDWTLYLDDRSPNHKESAVIMRELGDATGIDTRALVAFRPGMGGAREKLQWVSKRVTKVPEDVAYSLFGIFGVHLPVIYGEKKQNALGRLLQEIVAQSGDISALDWVGKSSEFNSCLPAEITSYQAPTSTLSSLSEDEIQTLVSSLRNVVAVQSASNIYTLLHNMSAARFAHRRLYLPCITFPVTGVRRRDRQETYVTYDVKTNGLHDLQIATEDKLMSSSRVMATGQQYLLVLPWDRHFLELLDFADDAQSNCETPPESPLHDLPGRSFGEEGLAVSEFHSRALRLIVRLGQPFRAFLLAQQRSGEYTRVAAEHNIIAQVKDVTFIPDMKDVRTLEIL